MRLREGLFPGSRLCFCRPTPGLMWCSWLLFEVLFFVLCGEEKGDGSGLGSAGGGLCRACFRDVRLFSSCWSGDRSTRRDGARVLSVLPPTSRRHRSRRFCGGPRLCTQPQEKEPGQKKEGKTHNDMWVLNMKAAASGGNPTWDRVRAFLLLFCFGWRGGGAPRLPLCALVFVLPNQIAMGPTLRTVKGCRCILKGCRRIRKFASTPLASSRLPSARLTRRLACFSCKTINDNSNNNNNDQHHDV